MLPCQQDRFSLPLELHYLNCAYMSPLPHAVEEAGVQGLRLKRIPTAIAPADFFTESDRVRTLFSRLIHLEDASRVAIVPSVSYGMAVVARNLPLSRGQTIVVAGEQFPSNLYPWRRLAGEAGADLVTVAPPEAQAGRAREWNQRLLDAITPRTALVALGHVHWADGTRFHLEAIGERARAVGAALVIDGTQSVGALPFDVRAIQPDALVCAGYKWLFGPYGAGVAYLGERFDHGTPLEENWINRHGSEDFRALANYRDEYQRGALRYDVGERSNPILLPMLRAALELVSEWGAENIQEYCRNLTRELFPAAQSLGFAADEESGRAAHLFGLRAPQGTDLATLQQTLAEQNVAVSVRGSAIRVSPHVYNTAKDIGALLDGLGRANQ